MKKINKILTILGISAITAVSFLVPSYFHSHQVAQEGTYKVFGGATIAYDAVSNYYNGSNLSIHTSAHTVGVGTDRVLTVDIAPTVATSVTYDGVAMTYKGSKILFGAEVASYVLANPNSGTHNIVVNLGTPTDEQVLGVSYTGVDQTTPFEATDCTQTPASTANPSFSITTISTDAWVHAAERGRQDGPATSWTGGTDRSAGTRYFSAGDTNAGAGAPGSKSITFNYGRVQDSTWGCISALKPAAGAVAAPVPPQAILFE